MREASLVLSGIIVEHASIDGGLMIEKVIKVFCPPGSYFSIVFQDSWSILTLQGSLSLHGGSVNHFSCIEEAAGIVGIIKLLDFTSFFSTTDS